MRQGKLRRNRERITVRGLNGNHNHDLKNLFKGAALSASTHPGPLYDFYGALLEKGMRPTMAQVSHPGQKDGRDPLNDLEERSKCSTPNNCIGKLLERLW